MKFQTNFIFLIKPFKYITKKSRQKLENKNYFPIFLKDFQLPKIGSHLRVRL